MIISSLLNKKCLVATVQSIPLRRFLGAKQVTFRQLLATKNHNMLLEDYIVMALIVSGKTGSTQSQQAIIVNIV